MNSEKWRTIEIPRQTILDVVAAHIYAMRGMDKRELTELDIPALLGEQIIIKIKMKEVSRKTSLTLKTDAQMAEKPQD